MNNNNEKKYKYKIYPKSERLTVVFLFTSVLVWGFYDRFTTGHWGVPLYLIIMTFVFNLIVRSYYNRKEKKKIQDYNSTKVPKDGNVKK
ncbi:hypothetical protein [Lysinibacillus sp. ZYM-1]|uniref:hypothetical protein n=1 Tax=Lysinibacillus sp. ZYM-1 TaxID=1681184 RepID=UPI0006CEA96F|nr:hypothetical protein [Lysinibacillus sp. ZYM-1]KPN96642.1 hypothetical protein AO843_15535 [Lysinibacillus sp. ZYM-1]